MVIGVDTGSRFLGLASAHLHRLRDTHRVTSHGSEREKRVQRMIPEMISWCKNQEESAPPITTFVIEQLGFRGVAGHKQYASMGATRSDVVSALKKEWPDAIYIDQSKGNISKQKAMMTARGLGAEKTISQDEADAVLVLVLAGCLNAY